MRIFLLIIFFSAFIFTQDVQAKVLPQAKKAVGKTSTGTSIGVSPRLRADRRALLVNFSNLQNAKSVSYSLTYKTSVQEEGALGSLNLSGLTNTSSELLFGTCSKNVCKYHTNISNGKLEVSYTSQTGKKYLKRFKIKV